MLPQILHNISAERLEVVHSIEPVLESNILPILKDIKKIWQPSDYLPDPASPDFIDEVLHLETWLHAPWLCLPVSAAVCNHTKHAHVFCFPFGIRSLPRSVCNLKWVDTCSRFAQSCTLGSFPMPLPHAGH